jgi:hypothetical protein
MTKTHWKTLPPWEELCAEILAEMEADALSPPDNVPSDPVMQKAFDDWDRHGRLIPWGSEMPELAIDAEEHDDAAGDQLLDLDGVIDRAMDLLKMRCSMPSCQISSEQDLTTTPTALRNGKSGGIRLWGYQLAAVGRMERMLEEQDCAVSASLRSVSCAVQRSLYLLTRTSIPLADGYDGPRGRRRRGTILVIVPLALMSNWYWVCVCRRSSLRFFFSQRLLTKYPDNGMSSPTSTDYTKCQLRTYDVVLTTYNIIRLQHVAMRDTTEEIAVWLRNQHREKEYQPKPRKIASYLTKR